MIRVALVGVSGRMGLSLIKAAALSQSCELTVAVSRPESLSIGKDAGELAGISALGVPVTDNLPAALDSFDVLIDFTRPEPSMNYIEICRRPVKKS